MAIFLAVPAVAQTIPEIAIDLDPSTPEVESTRTVTAGVPYNGIVRLLYFPTVGANTGFTGYNLKLQASPCGASGLCAASTAQGSHLLDAAAGQDTSDAASCTIGRVLLSTAAIFQDAPAVVFTFQYCVNEDVTLSFLANSPVYGLTTLGDAFLLQNDRVTVNTAGITVVPEGTDTPTPETTFTPTPTFTDTPVPTDTPTDTPTMPTPETTFTPTPTFTDTPVPTDTPTPTETQPPVVDLGLVMVDGFGGIHARPVEQVSVNLNCLADWFMPIHSVRDVEVTDQGALQVLEMNGHVWTYTLGETCFEQIPNESQFNFSPQDVAVAIETAGSADSAYILIDSGAILPVGNAADMSLAVSPPLPFRDGTPGDGAPTGQDFVIPGPVQGPGAIGTIATTGGWDGLSAIDFTMTGPDGALVLQRDGGVIPLGTATGITFEQSHTPWIWPDLARRIEYMDVSGTAYYIVADGLGGVHMAGPASSALRTSFETDVLGSLDYFAAVVGGNYVGIDVVNDFIPFVYNGGTAIGIMTLDGLGGIHPANVPFTYEPTAYLPNVDPVPGEPYSILDTAVSLSAIQLVQPQ